MHQMNILALGYLLLILASSCDSKTLKPTNLIYNDTCSQYFDPCDCDTPQNEKPSIYCFYITMTEIYDVFHRLSTPTIEMKEFGSYTLEGNAIEILPPNIFGSASSADRIIIVSNPNENRFIKIDENAFLSSQNATAYFTLTGFNVKELSWNFLNKFNKLKQLQLSSLFNISSSLITLSELNDSIKTFSITYSNGLVDIPDVPSTLETAIFISCSLDADTVKRILRRLSRASGSLTSLSLSHSLPSPSRVPQELKSLPKLESLFLDLNNIPELKAGDLSLPPGLRHLDLSNSNISKIEPGAFEKGVYVNAQVVLSFNPFTTLDEDVFQSMLEDMYSMRNGALHLEHTNLACGCDIKWLIVSNRHLLEHVVSGECANSSLFINLDPAGYKNCDSGSPSVSFKVSWTHSFVSLLATAVMLKLIQDI